MNIPSPRRFSIALSFPGEYRDFVEKVADTLAMAVSKDRVLYDKYHDGEFARLNLDDYLPNLYHTQSELVVIFLCPEYKNKRWCQLEWRHIKQLIATPDQDRIMLLSFGEPHDVAELGFLPGDGYTPIGSRQPDEIATLILKRHGLHTPQTITPPSAHQAGLTVNLNSDSGQQKEVKCANQFHGKQRKELLNFFVSDWLINGPAVAILQGIPRCGKTQLASAIAENSQRTSVYVLPQAESPNPSTDLLVDLAETLNDVVGIDDLKQEMDRGQDCNLLNALTRVLRREKILITIDEFQCLFSDADTYPPKQWQHLIEVLNNSPSINGRLMLISNRSVMTDLWCESCALRKLGGLTDTESAAFLLELLETSDITEKIPTERLEEVGHRLGGNLRALKTLVGSLKYDSLEDLISLAPDLFQPGDVDIDLDLVESFERALIERAIPGMGGDLLRFMRFMAVHRRPFTKEAFAKFDGTSVPPQALRKQLIDRFLLENISGWDSLHPLAREISVSRLRTEKEEWRQAHSLAANYHFSHFKTRQLGSSRKLTASYAELRHHLFEAGRIAELHLSGEKLTKFALSQIPKPVQSQLPDNVEALEERIALISALPDEHRPKGLEYHLALCLKHRNTGDDYRKALEHARNAVGPHAYYAAWLLLIELEYSLNGIDAMLRTQKKALEYLGGGSNSFSVYLRCAELLVKDNRLNDAIGVLEKGIDTPGVTCLSSLISSCSRYMEQAGQYDNAIRILKKGIDIPNLPELEILYLHCAKLLSRTEHLSDAIAVLKEGIKIPAIKKRQFLYQTLAEYLAKDGKDEEAIRWLKEGIADSKIIYPNEIYRKCAELLVANHRIDEAVGLLKKGIASRAVREPLPLYHSCAKIMEKTGNVGDAVAFLKKAMSIPRMSLEPSIYLTCAKLLFHARNLDDAIEVLKKGLSVSTLKGKGFLYQMLADLTARQGRTDEAIEILQKGIADKDEYHHYSLYQACSELMVKAGRIEDAIALMRKGIKAPAQANRAVLYQSCAKLLAQAGRISEGIALLLGAMRLPGMTGMVVLYQTCAQMMASVGCVPDAIKLLNKAITGPKMGNLVSLYQLCAELMLSSGRSEDAISLLKKGIVDYPGDNNLITAYEKASKS